jgi:predicted permease
VSVTPDLFPALGIAPLLGRTFAADEGTAPGLESTVILTHGLWLRRFGGDPAVVGRAVIVNDRARTVIGVMPPRFKFPHRAELYTPLRWDESPRSARNIAAVGILRSGASVPQAQSELDAIARRLESAYPDVNRGYGLRVMPFRDSMIGSDARLLSIILMAAVGFVLLVACANLANLMLVHGAARQREMALRAAMGAGRGRLLWIMLSESAILASAGAALGALAAVWALDWMGTAIPEEMPYWFEIAIDVRMVLFTVAMTVVTTVAVGLLPAWRASTPRVNETLKDSGRSASLGRSGQRMQSALAVAQVALSLALLIGANLVIRSFLAMQSTNLGFDDTPLLTARAYLAGDAYDEPTARATFFSRAVESLSQLPGVAAAAATTSIPGDDGGNAVRLVTDAQSSRDDDLPASSVGISGALFDVLGIRLLDGRSFSSDELMNPDTDVAIINARLAERLFPQQSAIDRRVGIRGPEGISWMRVVGVAPDVHYEEVGEQTDLARLNIYRPYASSGSRAMAFLLRASSAPDLLVQPMRDTLRRLNAGLPLFEVMPMKERRRFTTWEQRFFGEMMGSFAAIALLLACVGIYALLSYAARRRTQEIGVRLALGASPRDVVMLFVRQGGAIAAVGLLVGFVLALGVAQALSRAVWGVEPFDMVPMFGVAAALLLVVLVASYWPARRAGRVDPMIALRVD